MKRLLAFLALCLPVYLFAQGFGSFSHDQPYMAKDTAASNPGVQPVIDFWWHAADISSNNPIATWDDRIVGFQLVQSNSIYQPTNSSHGVCFDGRKSMEFIQTLKIPTNSSVFVSGYFSPMPRNQIIIYSTNGNEGLYLNGTNQPVTRYGGADYGITTAGNPTNFITLGYTTETNTTNLKLITYINGSRVSSNFFAGTASSLDLVGGWSDKAIAQAFGYLDYSLYGYITDLLVWTNDTLTDANMVFLHNMVSTNSPTLDPFFNPNSVAGLFSWVRADCPTIGHAAGGPQTNGVKAGIVPEGINLTQDINLRYASSFTPTWYSSLGPNGLPTIGFFGGGPPALVFNGSYSKSQPNTYFFVFQSTNSTLANQTVMDEAFSANRQAIYTTFAGPKTTLYAGTVADWNFPYSISNHTILTVTFNGASSWIRTNGVALGATTTDVGSNPMEQPTLGRDSTSGSPLKGFITEFLAYNGTLSTNDIATVEQYLRNKYGL